MRALQFAIDEKADKEEIGKIVELKSNKIDLENLTNVQGIMIKQFKHILVLFVESVKC